MTHPLNVAPSTLLMRHHWQLLNAIQTTDNPEVAATLTALLQGYADAYGTLVPDGARFPKLLTAIHASQ